MLMIQDSLQDLLTFCVDNMLKNVISLITIRSICVDQVPYNVFGYEFLTNIFCFGLLFIAGFPWTCPVVFHTRTHTQPSLDSHCTVSLSLLDSFFCASKIRQSEYCYRMSKNWIKSWRNDCPNS